MRSNPTLVWAKSWSSVCAIASIVGATSVTRAQNAEAPKATAPHGAALSSSAPTSPAATKAAERVPEAAPPTAAECNAALAKSQLFGASEQLIEAREQVRICSNPVCPAPVIAECVQSAGELDQAIPSVSFEVRLAGQQVVDAQVFADGKPVLDWIKGTSLRMNPGEHVFHFDLAGHPPITQTVKLSEGARYKAIAADFLPLDNACPAPATVAAPAAPRAVEVHYERPVPLIVYPLLGVGAASVLAFTGLGVLGQLEQHNLEQSCAPRCTDEEKSSMRKLYFAADISLGIGTAALVGAGILYLGRPEKARAPVVGATFLPGGGVATLTLRQF